MIKAKATKHDGKDIYIIGLSYENLQRLKDDKPIVFNGQEIGLGDCEILIFSAMTESLMAAQINAIYGKG